MQINQRFDETYFDSLTFDSGNLERVGLRLELRTPARALGLSFAGRSLGLKTSPRSLSLKKKGT